mgnify:CR=1 FL=1
MQCRPALFSPDAPCLTALCVSWSRAQKEPLLADEVYVQLIKQTSGNTSTESQVRGWKLIYLCIQSFPPAIVAVQQSLLAHIATHANTLRAPRLRAQTADYVWQVLPFCHWVPWLNRSSVALVQDAWACRYAGLAF